MKCTKLFLSVVLTVGLCVSSAFGQTGNVPPIVQGSNGNTAAIITPASSRNVQPNIVTPAQANQAPQNQVQNQVQNQMVIQNQGADFFADNQFVVNRNGGFSRFNRFGSQVVPQNWVNESARAYGGVLYIMREHVGTNYNIYQTAAAAPILTRDTFDFDFEFGFEFGVRRRFGNLELDARYMQVDTMNETANTFALAATDQLASVPPAPVGAAATTSVTYGSNIHSGELNFLTQYSTNTKVGLGFRTLQLNELLQNDFTPGGQLNFQTRNYLYGGQLVTETNLLLTNRMRWDFFSKNGFYGNNANRTMFANGVFVPGSRLSANEWTWIGESGIRGSLRITDEISISTGYQAIYFAGVALAPDQIPATTAAGPLAPITVDMSDSIYHGAFINIEVRR